MIGYTPQVGDIVALNNQNSTWLTVVALYSGNQVACMMAGSVMTQPMIFNVLHLMLMRSADGTADALFSIVPGVGNTGTGTVTGTSIFDGNSWGSSAETITFTDSTDYVVTDVNNNSVIVGVYSSPTTLCFSGITVTISGVPNAGDTFTLVPTSYRVT